MPALLWFWMITFSTTSERPVRKRIPLSPRVVPAPLIDKPRRTTSAVPGAGAAVVLEDHILDHERTAGEEAYPVEPESRARAVDRQAAQDDFGRPRSRGGRTAAHDTADAAGAG